MELWQAFLEVAPAGVAIFGPDMRYLQVSARWKRDYGLEGQDLIGRSHYEVFPEIPERWKEIHRQCLAGGEAGCDADPFPRADGGTDWVRWQIRPWHRRSGEIGGIVIFSEVITERVRAEQALKESEARYRALIEQAPEAIVIFDMEVHRTVHANRQAERLFGCDTEEIARRGLASFYHPEQPDGRPLAESMAEHRRLADAGDATPFERRLRNAKGEDLYCEVTLVRLPTAAGHLRRASFVDITARKHAEEERLRLAAQLQRSQRMEAIGKLTGGMAHDFNNLLAVILGNLDFLHDMPELPDTAREFVEGAIDAAVKGAELTRRLLAFARRQPLAPKLTDLAEVLERATKLLARTLSENITLDVQVADDLWPVVIDVVQLEAALLNLAVNARDAMSGGGRLTIEARNTTLDAEAARHEADEIEGDYAVISVSDTGIGMTPEIAAKAFDPFFTTKGPHASGLGLSMVHGFIRQSGGHTRLYSEPGRGTRIDLYLPRAAAAVMEEASEAAAVAQPRGPETVLAVEDNDALRLLTLRQLADLGYRTIEARNAAEALEVLGGAQAIDLLFTDVVMPGGMDGKQLADAARRLRPGLKVLFTSGFTAAGGFHGEIGIGEALLTKPYRKEALARRLRAALAGE